MASANNTQVPSKEIPTFTVNSSSNTSYAEAAQKHLYPKRDQGLLMHCVPGLTLTDYTCAIGDIVQPVNVLFASRISNNRICIYLSSKQLVDNITDKYKSIIIEQKTVFIRPLINKLKRVVFSNVAPEITDRALEDILDTLKVNRGSPVTLLKATITRGAYTHVGSFRRQVYVNPEDIAKIPEIFKINYEGLNFYIYASTDTLKCFLCNIEGHLAKNCKSADLNETKTSNSQLINTNLSNIITNNTLDEHISETPINQAVEDVNIQSSAMEINTTDNKRTHSEISSNTSQKETVPDPDGQFNKVTHKRKIIKKDDSNTQINNTTSNTVNSRASLNTDLVLEDKLDKKLIAIKNYLDEANVLLNYAQFKSLLENTYKVKNPKEIIQQYTDDKEKFIKFITEDIYPNVRNTSIKQRCTRLLNSIKNIDKVTTPPQTPTNSDTD